MTNDAQQPAPWTPYDAEMMFTRGIQDGATDILSDLRTGYLRALDTVAKAAHPRNKAIATLVDAAREVLLAWRRDWGTSPQSKALLDALEALRTLDQEQQR